MTSPLRVFQPQSAPLEPCQALTVRQIVDAWVSGTARKQTALVFAERQRLLELFCTDFGERAATSLRRFEVQDWISAHPKWKADNTIKRVLGTITCVFSWAAKGDRIEHNPLAGLSHPAGDRGRPLEVAEFAALLRTTTALFRRVLVFMRFTGVRPCEMSALEWAHIHLDRHCAIIQIHKTSRSRKDRAPRTIVLLPNMIKLLLWIRKRQKPGEKFVFLNQRGKPWCKNSLCLRVYRLREKLGMPKTAKLYGTRHLFGTEFILNVGDLKMLAELLGHTTTRMAEHYVHIAGKVGHLEAGLAKMFAGKKKT